MTDSREQNRARMPLVAAALDQFRAAFGPGVRVLYASENGHELGSPEHASDRAQPAVAITPAVVPDAPSPRTSAAPSQAKRPSGARHAPVSQGGLFHE